MKRNLNIKLSLYSDERIVIEDYNKLIDLTDKIIKVDIYTISGEFLKVRKMDSYMIEIVGTLQQIIIEEY